MRPAILAAAAVPFAPPDPTGPLRLLVVGGSQGARIMADIVPGAIERLEPALWNRLILTQQVRDEDMARVRAVYDQLKIKAELAPFFSDLPARLASSHLVVSRSGAGTVAELGAIGRPSILVPLPGAIDQDQFANAGVLVERRRRDPHRAERFHAGPSRRRNLRAGRRAGASRRDGRRARAPSASSMPPNGWPIWWRKWREFSRIATVSPVWALPPAVELGAGHVPATPAFRFVGRATPGTKCVGLSRPRREGALRPGHAGNRRDRP